MNLERALYLADKYRQPRWVFLVEILVVLGVIGVLAALLALRGGCANTVREKDACVQRGGVVNEYNCGQYGCTDWQCVED